ncbi:RICIN domain-containing protein [Streptomyces sp. AA4]|uniref:RICIN domain-containing protein n=1 Tax=Streptomyces sp. AA4 TaxID=591158 RepID=UPI0001DEE7DB|nr:RICIN domain-containing protein [Streptomyces sp. AA4]EFL09442.1 predicted protein [Streptomyces sp. AA4]
MEAHQIAKPADRWVRALTDKNIGALASIISTGGVSASPFSWAAKTRGMEMLGRIPIYFGGKVGKRVRTPVNRRHRAKAMVALLAVGLALPQAPALAVGDQSPSDHPLATERYEPVPSFLARFSVTHDSEDGSTSTRSVGSGAFIAPDLVVTAAHVVAQRTSRDQAVRATVSVTQRNGTVATVPVAEMRIAQGYPLPGGTPSTPENRISNDLAVVRLQRPVDNIEFLRLPSDADVNVNDADRIVATLFGRMVPSEQRITDTFHQVNNDRNGGAINSDQQRALLARITGGGAPADQLNVQSPGTPIVRLSIPRLGSNRYGGLAAQRFRFMYNDPEQAIPGLVAASRQAVSHRGDSGSPLVGWAHGEAYLAGVTSNSWYQFNSNDEFRNGAQFSTASVETILRSMGRYDNRPRDNFWNDPVPLIPSNANPRNYVPLYTPSSPELTVNDPTRGNNFADAQECDNPLCHYVAEDEELSTYSVRPRSLRVADGGDSGGEYEVYGQLAIFSPQDNPPYTVLNNSAYPAPGGLREVHLGIAGPRFFDVPEEHPVDIPIGPDGNNSRDYSLPNSSTAIPIQSSQANPTFCIATPTAHGLYEADSGNDDTIVPTGQISCVNASASNANPDGTYNIQLNGSTGSVTVTLEVTRPTDADYGGQGPSVRVGPPAAAGKRYAIGAAAGDKLILNTNGKPAGSPVVLSNQDLNDNKLWEAKDSTTNGYVQFVNVHTGLALDGGGATNKGANVLIQPLDPKASSQDWKLQPTSTTGEYLIVNRSTNMVLDNKGAKLAQAGTALQQSTPNDDNPKTHWTLTEHTPPPVAAGKHYAIGAAAGDKLILNTNGKPAGSPVVLSNQDLNDNKLWEAKDSTTNGYVQFVNVHTGLALDGGGATNKGANVLIQPLDPKASSQDWKLQPTSTTGEYLIVNRSTNMVLDNKGAKLAQAGTALQQSTPNDDNPKTHWTFTAQAPAPAPAPAAASITAPADTSRGLPFAIQYNAGGAWVAGARYQIEIVNPAAHAVLDTITVSTQSDTIRYTKELAAGSYTVALRGPDGTIVAGPVSFKVSNLG